MYIVQLLSILEKIYDANQDRELKSNRSFDHINYVLHQLHKLEKYDFDKFLTEKIKNILKEKLDANTLINFKNKLQSFFGIMDEEKKKINKIKK